MWVGDGMSILDIFKRIKARGKPITLATDKEANEDVILLTKLQRKVQEAANRNPCAIMYSNIYYKNGIHTFESAGNFEWVMSTDMLNRIRRVRAGRNNEYIIDVVFDKEACTVTSYLQGLPIRCDDDVLGVKILRLDRPDTEYTDKWGDV